MSKLIVDIPKWLHKELKHESVSPEISIRLLVIAKLEMVGEGDSLIEFVRKLSKHIDNGGSYCGECGIFFDTIIEGRKHDFQEHYDYALAQCNGDTEQLKKWMDLKD